MKLYLWESCDYLASCGQGHLAFAVTDSQGEAMDLIIAALPFPANAVYERGRVRDELENTDPIIMAGPYGYAG